MMTTKTTKHDKTKAKSGKSTPKERDSTARTRSYPIIMNIIMIKKLFIARLKQCLLVAERICSGREFQMEGPATEKNKNSKNS